MSKRLQNIEELQNLKSVAFQDESQMSSPKPSKLQQRMLKQKQDLEAQRVMEQEMSKIALGDRKRVSLGAADNKQ